MPKAEDIPGDASRMMIELSLDRRTPEDYRDRPVDNRTADMLSGLLVAIDRTEAYQDEENRDAIWTIRTMCLQHECEKAKSGDPSVKCTNRLHWRDVAAMRVILAMCGLPGKVPVTRDLPKAVVPKPREAEAREEARIDG